MQTNIILESNYVCYDREIAKRSLLMKVEVTIELDINLYKTSVADIKKLLEEMMDSKNSMLWKR